MWRGYAKEVTLSLFHKWILHLCVYIYIYNTLFGVLIVIDHLKLFQSNSLVDEQSEET